VANRLYVLQDHYLRLVLPAHSTKALLTVHHGLAAMYFYEI
jgi:hypothetical protein